MSKVLFLLVCYTLLMPPAHAYIDASTGSFVVQAVLGVVLSIIVPLQSFWAKRLTLKRNTGEN